MEKLLNISKKQVITILALIICALLIPALLTQTYVFGPLILVALAGIAVLIAIFSNYQYGVYVLFTYGCFIFYIDRLLPVNVPLGVFFDLLIAIMFIAMVIQNKGKKPFQWKFNEVVTWAHFIFYVYFLLQIANPNAVSISAWLVAARLYTLFLLFYILIHFFSTKENVRKFFKMVLVLAVLIAVYGLYQEIFGLTGFENRWLYETPERYKLLFIMGRLRKFSFLSDPSAFGIFLAFTSLTTLIFMFGQVSTKTRAMLIISFLVMLVSMSFAGTRTAFAMVAIGVVFFILLNIRDRKIMFASIFLILGFFALMFGPFHSGPISRIRTTFNLSEDASMSVRDVKRIRFQPYIQSNPIGGGLNTAGNGGLRHSRGHPLAGKFDPDSGYLRTALEMGIIGLFLSLFLNCAVLIKGIRNHYTLINKDLRIYNLALIVPFIAISVAHYTQDALLQKPVNILVVAAYVLVIKLKDLDSQKNPESSNG